MRGSQSIDYTTDACFPACSLDPGRQTRQATLFRQILNTKRADPYLRMLLIHGARSVVYRVPNKSDSRSQWIAEKQRKIGTAKACVAVANKKRLCYLGTPGARRTVSSSCLESEQRSSHGTARMISVMARWRDWPVSNLQMRAGPIRGR